MQNPLTINLSDELSFDMIFIEGGEFTMGDDQGEYDDEKPEHEVNLSSFYMGEHVVTQELWQVVMGDNPSKFKGAKRPVETVSWEEAKGFIQKLNEKTKRNFRLPTEAEWEYVAKGGKYSQEYKYAGSDKLTQVAWYTENSNNETHEVGLLLANELGLYDMSGNVYEWCADWFDEEYYEKCKAESIVEDPVNDKKASNRVVRGGGYFTDAVSCRPTNRFGDSPGYRFNFIGFRLVVSFQSVG